MESLVQGQLARRVRWGGCRNVRSERNAARCVLTQSSPVGAFTAADVVSLYLHRGAFETLRASEDQEQDSDRWCSHTACGQECWQILSQWVWNLRLALGHALHPTPMRTTAFAPAQAAVPQAQAPAHSPAPTYGPPQVVAHSRMGCLPGSDFQPPLRWDVALSREPSALPPGTTA